MELKLTKNDIDKKCNLYNEWKSYKSELNDDYTPHQVKLITVTKKGKYVDESKSFLVESGCFRYDSISNEIVISTTNWLLYINKLYLNNKNKSPEGISDKLSESIVDYATATDLISFMSKNINTFIVNYRYKLDIQRLLLNLSCKMSQILTDSDYLTFINYINVFNVEYKREISLNETVQVQSQS